jgi:hypothetical protein
MKEKPGDEAVQGAALRGTDSTTSGSIGGKAWVKPVQNCISGVDERTPIF